MKHDSFYSETLKLGSGMVGRHVYQSSVADASALCPPLVRRILGSLPNTITATVSIRKIDGAIPISVYVSPEEGHYKECWRVVNEEASTDGAEIGMYEYAFRVLYNLLDRNGLSIYDTNTIWLKVVEEKD
jgi:hypothetical protein